MDVRIASTLPRLDRESCPYAEGSLLRAAYSAQSLRRENGRGMDDGANDGHCKAGRY